MTEPTRNRWRAVHRMTSAQRVKPSLAAATVGALFGAELLAALQRRGLFPDGAVPAAKPAPSAAKASDAS